MARIRNLLSDIYISQESLDDMMAWSGNFNTEFTRNLNMSGLIYSASGMLPRVNYETPVILLEAGKNRTFWLEANAQYTLVKYKNHHQISLSIDNAYGSFDTFSKNGTPDEIIDFIAGTFAFGGDPVLDKFLADCVVILKKKFDDSA